MNIKRSKFNYKLFLPSALMLVALVLLSLAQPSLDTGATSPTDKARQETQMVTARTQAWTSEDVPLAGAEAWAQAQVEINNVPDGALVSSVQVKYHVVYSEPADLQVQLLNSGVETAHSLWNRESAEGDVLAQSSEEIMAFQGAPVNSVWTLAVQGGDSEGYIDDFSVVVYFETDTPIIQIEGAPGMPGFLSLPEGITPSSPSPDQDDKPAATESSVVPQYVPPGAVIFKADDFEGSFPNGLWGRFDNSNDGYERYWDDVSCDKCGADWALWPADNGADSVNVCAGNNYPNNMEAWLTYGPFDLSPSEYTNAGTEFNMWHEIETDYDFVFFGYSGDGYNFSGWFFDGYNDCTVWTAYYPSILGDPSVWVAWVFGSDSSVTYDGPFVDDVVIWAEPSVPVCADFWIEPVETFANAGSTFSLDVVVNDAADLGAFEFELLYDPACITAIDANLGPFLGSTGRSFAEVGPTITSGSVTYGGYSWGSASGPNGSGVLASVTFEAGSSECDSAVVLTNVSLADTNGASQCIDLLYDGVVHVTDPCNPDCPEDINGDGVIDIVDIMLVASKWGQSCPTVP